MHHEAIARQKRELKEQKLAEFQNKTKANAMKKMRETHQAKKDDANAAKMKAKEN